ncbi:MAG: hypothetical protein VKN33_08630 [Candidatus Sericytochromatia bacterium]|nr:hypothetical protein [Candidatus Sericytochromatia bacterium]
MWLPGFAVILLQDALFPLGLQHGRLPHLMGALAAAVAATMLLAGWYALMARVLRGGVATFRDFIDGINARWMTMVAGTCVYWLLIGSLAAIIFWYGQRSIGLDPLLAWFKPLLELPTAQQQAALEPSRIPRAVIEWMNLAAIWVSLVVALNALLVFWAPLAILQGQRWTAAWLGSAGLCLRRLGQVIAIGTLHIGSLLFARILMASFQPLTVMAGVALYMFSLTYFTMVYATVVEDEWPVDAKQTDLRA